MCTVHRLPILTVVSFWAVFKAHTGSVRGVAVDGLNQLTVTAGSERLLKFWNFKSKALIHSLSLESSPNMLLLHRDRSAFPCDSRESLLMLSVRTLSKADSKWRGIKDILVNNAI